MAINKLQAQQLFKNNQSSFPVEPAIYKQLISTDYTIGDLNETVIFSETPIQVFEDSIKFDGGFILNEKNNMNHVYNISLVCNGFDIKLITPRDGDIIVYDNRELRVKAYKTDPFKAVFTFQVN